MPRSPPETHPCPDHPKHTYTVCWEWRMDGTIEDSEPVWLKSCPACDRKRTLEEADDMEEAGEHQAASILRVRAAELPKD